jgi:tetratricopeptide (TPR) repeat protein
VKLSARLEKLAAALGNDPALAPVYDMRGRAYYFLGRWDKAADDFTKAIDLVPDAWSYRADRGEAHDRRKEWNKAFADFSKALELNGGSPYVWCGRGDTYAELGHWTEAAADFAKAVELKSVDPRHHYRRALTLLRLGDVAGYRKLCADMLGQWDLVGKSDPDLLAVWTCVVAPDAVKDWNVPLQLAEAAVADSPKSYFALHQLGAVLYRAGRSKEALERLTEAEAAFRPDDTTRLPPIVINWLFLALTHQSLGHVEEAKECHTKSVQRIKEESQKAEEAGNPFRWPRRVCLQLLRVEVEESIGKGNK